MSTPDRFRGQRFELKPFPCPLCGEVLTVEDLLKPCLGCPHCHGDWQTQAIINACNQAGRRLGERLAQLQHERILKVFKRS